MKHIIDLSGKCPVSGAMSWQVLIIKSKSDPISVTRELGGAFKEV